MKKSTINKFKNVNNKKIILASESPRRKKILKDLGFNFKAIKSNVSEEKLIQSINKHFKNKNIYRLIKLLSLSKAISALNKTNHNGYVIGCDTVVVCKKEIIGKPTSKKDALKKLSLLSNRSHKVVTAISILDTKHREQIKKLMGGKKKQLEKLLAIYNSKYSTCGYDATKVIMKKISREDALEYIDTKEPFGKAGAYAIQGIGRKFVNAFEGDFYTVVGFPVDKFYLIFKNLTK